MEWTQEQASTMVMLINEKKMSCKEVGCELHRTKSAVISKAHQLLRKGIIVLLNPSSIHMGDARFKGWKPRAAKKEFNKRMADYNTEKRKIVSVGGKLREVAVHSPIGRILFKPRVAARSSVVAEAVMDLREDQCRWSAHDLSDPRFFFCDGRKVEGTSWCALHLPMMFEGRR